MGSQHPSSPRLASIHDTPMPVPLLSSHPSSRSRGCLLLLTEEGARVLWESSARVDANEGLRSVNEKRVSLGGGLGCVRGECTPRGSLAGVSAGVWVRSSQPACRAGEWAHGVSLAYDCSGSQGHRGETTDSRGILFGLYSVNSDTLAPSSC